MKVIKIKNSNIISFVNWLGNQKLSGKESRNRTRFIGLLVDRANEVQKERIAILEKYADRNDKGELNAENLPDGGKKYLFTDIIKQNEANKELEEYLKEEFVIDVLESNKNIINTIKDIVLNTEEEFSGIDAVQYSEWCESFE